MSIKGGSTVYSVVKAAYSWQNMTRGHYTTLPGSMASYGKRTQTCIFKNHANLLSYLANWLLYILENGIQGNIKHQGGPFPRYAQVFSVLIVQKTARMGS